MLANTITFFRLFFTFVVIALLGRHPALDIAGIFSIALIFAMDAVDGLVARRRNETSKTGALLDTLADRIVENTFWIYFCAIGQLPVWMPIVVMARGVLTDTLQHLHHTPTEGWEYALTRSRISRGLYGFLKMIAFMSLATTSVFNNPRLETFSFILTTLTVGVCLLRGLPFFFIRNPSCSRST